MTFFSQRPFTTRERADALATLAEQTTPDRDYAVLVVGAIGLALGALFLDSTATLIGAMVVAPLAYPILALGLGAVAGNRRLFVRSLALLGASLAASVALAYLGTLLFGFVRVDSTTIAFVAHPALDAAIAFVAGAVAAYGLARPKVGGAMTGIGIAVSLMPPLVATGAYAADGLSLAALHAFLIFMMNVLGIFFGSIAVFVLVYKARA